MENPRSGKVAVVEEVREHFVDSDAVILTEYRGLKVKEMAALRRTLTPVGGQYKVYKNTLIRFAARDAGVEGLDALLEGPTGIAFVKGDAAAAAKALRDFSRTQPLLVIKGGVLGDKILDVTETAALADLPSRDVLLAQFAGALAAPLQQMAGLLQALPRSLAYGLAALLEQRQEAEGEPTPPTPVAETEPEVAESPEPEVAESPEPEVAESPEPEVAESPEPEVAKSPEAEVAEAPAEPESGGSTDGGDEAVTATGTPTPPE